MLNSKSGTVIHVPTRRRDPAIGNIRRNSSKRNTSAALHLWPSSRDARLAFDASDQSLTSEWPIWMYYALTEEAKSPTLPRSRVYWEIALTAPCDSCLRRDFLECTVPRKCASLRVSDIPTSAGELATHGFGGRPLISATSSRSDCSSRIAGGGVLRDRQDRRGKGQRRNARRL